MPSEFERVVRDAMDQRDLSLAALARESGVDRGRWYAWFRGAHIPKARTLTGPAHALGLTVDDLLAPFGGLTEKPGTVMVPGLSDLLEALVDQTAAISELAAVVRSTQRERADLEERVAALEAGAMLRVESNDETAEEHPAPRDSGR